MVRERFAFAFCRLLGFQLLPRLKNIGRQRLYRPAAGQPDAYPRLQHVLSRPIDWELIGQQYDEGTSFRAMWLRNVFVGIIASFVFTPLVLIGAAIYRWDPSPFVLFKEGPQPAQSNHQ